MKNKSATARLEAILKDVWVLFLRPFIITAATIFIIYFGVTKAVNYVAENFFLPPEPGATEEFKLEIPQGYGVRGISKILEDNGVISNSFVFRLFVDVSNNSYKLQSGKYYFTKGMSMQEVMEQIVFGTNSVEKVWITIPEGWTLKRIASYLVNTKGLTTFTEEEFIAAATPENFPEYKFLEGINEERLKYGHSLQGYLFPDTYLVYADSTAEDIIVKMLDNFEYRISEEVVEIAEQHGYTVDELITFASVLEKEGGSIQEFARVAACFTNRLNQDMRLQSDATIFYVLDLMGEVRDSVFDISDADTEMDNPYNTYQKSGLPIGPICNPGMSSILAVVNPNQEDIEAGVLYFTLNPDTGTNTFTTNYEDHVYYSKLYYERWLEIQKEQNEKPKD